MKHDFVKKLIGLCALLGATGCVDDASSIHIRNVIGNQPTADCVIQMDDQIQKGRGSLNVGYTRSYIAAVLIENALLAEDLQQQGQPFNRGSRNDFHINSVTLRYELNIQGVTLPTRTIASSGTVPAGGRLALGINMMTFDNAEILAAAALPNGGAELKVFMKLTGRFTHGSEMETAEFMYPLTVFSVPPPTCAAGEELAEPDQQVTPCGNLGQDGTRLICKKAEN